MVVLKKIKASTLMETLVATVLIVVVFMVASMILNTVFYNSIKNNTTQIEAQLNELEYKYINDKLILPHQEDFEDWQVTVEKHQDKNEKKVIVEAKNNTTYKVISKDINDIKY